MTKQASCPSAFAHAVRAEGASPQLRWPWPARSQTKRLTSRDAALIRVISHRTDLVSRGLTGAALRHGEQIGMRETAMTDKKRIVAMITGV